MGRFLFTTRCTRLRQATNISRIIWSLCPESQERGPQDRFYGCSHIAYRLRYCSRIYGGKAEGSSTCWNLLTPGCVTKLQRGLEPEEADRLVFLAKNVLKSQQAHTHVLYIYRHVMFIIIIYYCKQKTPFADFMKVIFTLYQSQCRTDLFL